LLARDQGGDAAGRDGGADDRPAGEIRQRRHGPVEQVHERNGQEQHADGAKGGADPHEFPRLHALVDVLLCLGAQHGELLLDERLWSLMMPETSSVMEPLVFVVVLFWFGAVAFINTASSKFGSQAKKRGQSPQSKPRARPEGFA